MENPHNSQKQMCVCVLFLKILKIVNDVYLKV